MDLYYNVLVQKYQVFFSKNPFVLSLYHMLDFWKNVKEELDYNLKTQKELASAIGVSYNTLQSWITKDRLPDAEQALRIAKQLNTSLEYLVTGKTEEQKGVKQKLQNMIPKLNHLSDDNLDLIDVIAGRLK